MCKKLSLFIFLFCIGLYSNQILYAQGNSPFKSYSSGYKKWWQVNNEIGPMVGTSFILSDLGGLSGTSKGFLLDLDLIASRAAVGFQYRNNHSAAIGFRANLIYATLAAADKFSNASDFSQDGYFRKVRQFNTRTHVLELTLLTELNIFPFIPGDLNTRFAPFIGLGIGTTYYQPQTNINGKWENLRQFHTEGQMVRLNSTARADTLPDVQVGYYPLRKQYPLLALIAPIHLGFKFNITRKTMLTFEFAYRFTNTDYLDDVSRTYPQPEEVLVTVGLDPNSSVNQERYMPYINPGAYITDDEGVPFKPSYTEGEQRGDPSDTDGYGFTTLFTVSYLLKKNPSLYNCPTRYAF